MSATPKPPAPSQESAERIDEDYRAAIDRAMRIGRALTSEEVAALHKEVHRARAEVAALQRPASTGAVKATIDEAKAETATWPAWKRTAHGLPPAPSRESPEPAMADEVFVAAGRCYYKHHHTCECGPDAIRRALRAAYESGRQDERSNVAATAKARSATDERKETK